MSTIRDVTFSKPASRRSLASRAEWPPALQTPTKGCGAFLLANAYSDGRGKSDDILMGLFAEEPFFEECLTETACPSRLGVELYPYKHPFSSYLFNGGRFNRR